MALQIAYQDQSDNDYPAAYARIEEINLHFQDKRAHLVVAIYKSQTAMQRDKRPVGFAQYDMAKDAGDYPAFDAVFGQSLFDAKKTDPRALGYTFLKTLPMFSAGTDV